jgi:hypothetical protein
MPDQSDQRRRAEGNGPGPARLFALAAGILLSLLGVLGFFYDAGFDTGKELAADDVAGVIVVNGWSNVVYLVSGLLALGFAARRPRRSAAALGLFYLVFGLWGLAETDHDIGSILEVIPLRDTDNVFHLLIGALGTIAALADGPLPKAPKLAKRAKETKRPTSSRSRA